jgi:thiosulfate/3-mercaptopyruvate sulfurtransferase
VVVYDDANGSIASRLWWMLRWLGHEAVAVLDGGMTRWQTEGRPVKRGTETRPARIFTPEIHSEMVVSVDEVNALRQQDAYRVVDSRAANRYRGEDETLDPVAGHIPGAVCAPFGANVGPDGRFLAADEIRARLEDVLAGRDPSQAIFYCGSGVTAAHNVLAMEYAGLSGARLYAGSWSEWITDPDRPVATGPNP